MDGTTPVHEANAPISYGTNNSAILDLCCPAPNALPGVPQGWQLSPINPNGAPPTPTHILGSVSFPDSVGVFDIYLYDGFGVNCTDTAVDLSSGHAVKTSSSSADVKLDCANNQLVLQGGYQFVGPTVPDELGSYLQNLHDYTQVPSFTSAGTTMDKSIVLGVLDGIVIIKDKNGLYHKLMIWGTEGNNGTLSAVYCAQMMADINGAFSI
jgi:hypothetical protein